MAQRKLGTNELDEAVDRVRDARAELARLHAEFARCSSAASEGAARAEALEQLRAQRHELMTEAFADNASANTHELDASIAQAETAHAEAIADAAVARDAMHVIRTRISAQQDLLDTLRAEWREQAQRTLLQALDTAEADFGRAVAALGEPVARLTAIASLWKQITGKPVPADGRDGLLDAMRGVPALRVRWDFSPLKHPEVSGRFAPESYQGAARFVPAWLAPSSPDFGVRELNDLRALLQVGDVQGV